MSKNGVVDEWGAVIQKQVEGYEREQSEAKLRK